VAIEPLAAEALAAVERGADNADEIAAALDLSGGEAAALLADLEARGYLSCSLLGTYTRTLLQAP
jgi:DNA-binding IclR family transcriptional regulator